VVSVEIPPQTPKGSPLFPAFPKGNTTRGEKRFPGEGFPKEKVKKIPKGFPGGPKGNPRGRVGNNFRENLGVLFPRAFSFKKGPGIFRTPQNSP